MPNLFHLSSKSSNKIKIEKEKNGKAGTESVYTAGMRYVSENLVGSHAMVQSPFGDRRMTYADYTASGRSLYMIENYISKYVMSYYGNTHTSTSFNSMQTSKFREDAKNMIRKCCNTNADDVVIFCGSGATGAIHKLIGVLELKEGDIGKSVVVFLGPYEHHSNILPWKETGAKLVRILEDRQGQLDQEQLEKELKEHSTANWKLRIGTFSACSNVTGLLVDTVAVTQLMHAYDGLAFWDYAAGAPYLKMDMNPNDDSGIGASAFKDAMFCSPHKFVGGPGSPGLLIAKKSVFTNSSPHGGGGGTVVYVSKKRHSYTKDIEAREEGGTPGIIEAIRAGLVFQLKSAIGIDNILKRENYLARKGINQLHGNPNIILLGSKISPRVPILSFAVRHPASKKLVHHNFIALLLNDLFGIQARGGCACAGPYAEDLLGIAEEISEGIMAFLDLDYRRNSIVSTNDGHTERLDKSIRMASSLGIMKPGFIRLNLGYFMPDDEIEFILSAVNIVANEGWKLLPQYSYDIEHGSWQHRREKSTYKLMTLNDITYDYNNQFHMVVKGIINPRSEPAKRQSYFQIMNKAKAILESAESTGRELFPFDEVTMKDFLPDNLLPYVWWLEPHYAMLSINSLTTKSLAKMRVASIPLKPRIESGPVHKNPSKLAASNRYAKIIIGSNPQMTNQMATEQTSTTELEKVAPEQHMQSSASPSANEKHLKRANSKIPDSVMEWVHQINSGNLDYENHPSDEAVYAQGAEASRNRSAEHVHHDNKRPGAPPKKASHHPHHHHHKARRQSSPAEPTRKESRHRRSKHNLTESRSKHKRASH